MPRVSLCHAGLVLDGKPVPLLAGAVHYWRLEPRFWRPALQAVRDMGLRLVDTYVPWSVHEIALGEFELGRTDPQRDVGAFLRLAHEIGLYAIVRPGPHINAELAFFGLPERVVWDPECQAKSRSHRAVILPVPPRMFPVPSYASEAFRAEVARWFGAVAPVLSPLCYPDGPIVLVQVDNEGAMYFRDGAFDQDYHPDAIAEYRGFLRAKYGSDAALAAAHGQDQTIAEAQPPTELAAREASQLGRYLDWAEFQEQLLADALGWFREALATAGLRGVPTVHNFPLAQEATPLNAARVGAAVDLVGLDYYGRASPAARRDVARRTTELAIHCETRDLPAFACELGAGFPPVFPPLDERDSLFTAMCALAYGLRGFNLYMAVERDRWIGAPIDTRGRARPFADAWRLLCAGLSRCDFFELRRRTPVRLVVPRVERRLARLMHAFGPVSAAVLSLMGLGPRESCVEDDLGLGFAVAIEHEAFIGAFEDALTARGVPFALCGGEHKADALRGASWIVCATSGALSPALAAELVAAGQGGAHITIGPRRPRFDGSFKPADHALLLDAAELCERSDPATADAIAARMIERLGLPRHACDPDSVQATVHEDAAGKARALFAINATAADAVARIALAETAELTWQDVMTGERASSSDGLLELRVQPKTVRMLARL